MTPTEDELRREKLRADAMRHGAPYPEENYWLGYRQGLLGRDRDHHTAILGGLGMPDQSRAARARGYRDGLAFRGEPVDDAELAAAAAYLDRGASGEE